MPKTGCEGSSPAFSPDTLFAAWADGELGAPAATHPDADTDVRGKTGNGDGDDDGDGIDGLAGVKGDVTTRDGNGDGNRDSHGNGDGNGKGNDFRTAITRAFNLKEGDAYVYHAVASVTLAQVQRVIGHGGRNGLLAWYRDGDGVAVCVLCLCVMCDV